MWTLEYAKEKVGHLINGWVIVPESTISQEDPNAIFPTVASIEQLLGECKLNLTPLEFTELIHFALEEAEVLLQPLRQETREYFYGGVRHTVERPEFTQLKAMLQRQLKPVELSAYLTFFATTLIPAVLIILIVSAIPSAAAAAVTNANVDADDADSTGASSRQAIRKTSALQVNYEQTIRDVETAEQNSRAMMKRMGIDYDAIPSTEFVKPSIDIRRKEGQKTVETLANQLVGFYEQRLAPEQERKLIQRLLNDETLIQPLNVILMNSDNKMLLYKIAIKLTNVLYNRMFENKRGNFSPMVASLGHVIMAMPPNQVAYSSEEASAMINMLFLYQPHYNKKEALSQRIREILPAVTDSSHFSSLIIAGITGDSPSEKSRIKSYLSKLLEIAEKWVVLPLKEENPLSLSSVETVFLNLYPEAMRGIVQLFNDENPLSSEKRYALLTTIDNAVNALMKVNSGNHNNTPRVNLITACRDVFFTISRKRKLLLEEEQAFTHDAMKFSSIDPDSSIKIFEILAIYNLYLGNAKAIIEYYEMTRDLQKKYQVSQAGIRQQNEFFSTLLSAMSEKLPVNSNPAELPPNEASTVSLVTRIVPWGLGFASLAWGVTGIKYSVIPPAAIAEQLLTVISGMHGACLTLKKRDYYAGWWLTQIVYDIQQYELLGFFNPAERNTILQGILSTPDFTVDADASKEELMITVKPKHWHPNWDVYFNHLSAVMQLPQLPILKSSLMDKIGALLQHHLKCLKFEGPVEIGAVNAKHLSVKIELLEAHSVYLNLCNIFKRNGINTVYWFIEGDLMKLEWLIPFFVLDLEGDFKNDFIQVLRKINDELEPSVSERIKYKRNLDCIAKSLRTFHSANDEISFNMGATEFIWKLKLNGNYQICNTEIAATSAAQLLQYLLYTLYGINSTIIEGEVSHSFPQEVISDKREEADLLMRNILTRFSLLRERYKPAICELVFIDGTIKMQLSVSKIESFADMKVNAKEFCLSVKEELLENNVSAQSRSSRGKELCWIDLSPEKDIEFKFSMSFAERVADKKHKVQLKEVEEKEKETALEREKETAEVLKRLNGRLKDFMPGQNLKWDYIKGNETTLGFVLTEENYYALVRNEPIFISRNGLIAFMQRDLQKNCAVEPSAIVSRGSKKGPKKYRVELKDPWLAKVGDDSIEQKNWGLLKILPQLAELYYPMQIILDYAEPNFNVCFKLNADNYYEIQPYGLSHQGFIECVQKSLEAAIKADGVVTVIEGRITVPFYQLNSTALPSKSDFFAIKEKQYDRENSLSTEEEGEGKEKEDKNDAVERNIDKKKRTETLLRPSQPIPPARGVIPSLMVPEKPQRYNGDQRFLRRPVILFNVLDAKKEIDRLFDLIEQNLKWLNGVDTYCAGVEGVKKTSNLYIHLSNLLEELVKCHYQFNSKRIPKSDWFNIQDPENLLQLRAHIIKNINNPQHTAFCRFVANKVWLGMKHTAPFLVNIQDITEQGLTHAVLTGYQENGHLDIEEATIDYDEIRQHIGTLQGSIKGGERELKLWIQRNMDFARALIVRSVQLFNKKNEDSRKNTEQNLGEPLYRILYDHFRPYRNLTIHEKKADVGEEINALVCLIMKLDRVSIERSSQNYGGSSQGIFGANGVRRRDLPSSTSSSSSSQYGSGGRP